MDSLSRATLTGRKADLTFTMRFAIVLIATSLLVSCSSLPIPGETRGSGSGADAAAVLERSAAKTGDPWKNYRSVKVSYDGEWSSLTTRLQPVLTDVDFRKRSLEVYQPRSGKVIQNHTGPLGTKQVIRQRPKTEVLRNGIASKDSEVIAAAALVADAYTVFLFGPSWLVSHGRDLTLIESGLIDSERCDLVTGKLSPGFGSPADDHFIAWIGRDSGLMRRFQFSLNGLDSTRGADVDVTFSEHWKAADGSVWPGHFVEYIQRPIRIKAHDWRMTGLWLDGVKSR